VADRPADPPHQQVSETVGPETVERFGRPMRLFPVAVSAGAMAGAWARQEGAPAGATVVVEREVSALGRLGRAWERPPATTLSLAMVLRPPLAPDQGDVAWLVAGLGLLGGLEAAVPGHELATWWPDEVIDAPSGEVVAATKVEVQLGAGEVKAAVAVLRVDLARLGAEEAPGRDAVLEAVVGAVDEAAATLAEGAEEAAAAYERRCSLVGRRVKLRLMPKGETRGTVRSFDRSGRLELASASGMIERISVDMLRELQAV
jgi:biotin-(acetyl-CoA carboxylase) ligase